MYDINDPKSKIHGSTIFKWYSEKNQNNYIKKRLERMLHMKKFLNISIIFTIIGLALGVYYREATKLTNFFDTVGAKTQLSVGHTHTLILGVILPLIFGGLLHMKNKGFDDVRKSMITYLIGISLTILMIVFRGSLDIFVDDLSKGLDALVSGLSGLAHIVLGVGFLWTLFDLRKIFSDNNHS